MVNFQNLFEDRKKEIKDYFKLLEFLEEKVRDIDLDTGVNAFEKFFQTEEKVLEYQSVINIMKSNATLMLYNIIEFTIAGLINVIYDKICAERLCYKSVSGELQYIWRQHCLKDIKKLDAGFSSFVKKNEEMIKNIIEEKIIILKVEKTMSGGNLNGEIIVKTLRKHGIEFPVTLKEYRPDKFNFIKNKRNELAHGESSFSEALRDKTIFEIIDYGNDVFSFLEYLINLFKEYMEKEKYKNCGV